MTERSFSTNLVAERLVDETGWFLGTITKEIALPEEGIFPKAISCILVSVNENQVQAHLQNCHSK
nr:unnamed protein product [Callosobruchus chinensis]